MQSPLTPGLSSLSSNSACRPKQIPKNGFPDFALSKRYYALISEKEDMLLVKPQTFMNESGKSVKAITKNTKGDLVVIHDDIDLAVGKVKKKIGGGDAGHRGIRSIIESIATSDFHRIRIGVGRPPKGVEASDYVLSPFHRDELDIIDGSIEKAINLVKEILKTNSH